MRTYLSFLLFLLFLLCGGQILSAAELTAEQKANLKETLETQFKQAQATLEEATEAKRLESAGKSFEEFKASVYQEPFEGGKYIVNGDTPIANEKQLLEFFEKNVKSKPLPPSEDFNELIVHRVGGLDAAWSIADKRRLLYCVSNDFAGRHTNMVAAMQTATAAWEAIADVDFIYLETENHLCTASNNEVVFDVRPVNVGGQYLARAFFPNDARPSRNVLVDESAFGLDPNGKLTLTGILRHELGHTLGFRHEHTRPESGKCFEDNNWRPLNDYDPFSVMHYPQCNGLGDWSLTLTAKDMNGAACLYGPAPGFTVDPAYCTGDAAKTKTETFDSQAVALGEDHHYAPSGPFKVKPGTMFTAEMHGSGDNPGDPDLYLKFDDRPSVAMYDCRPYLIGAEETCSVEVPQGKQLAAVTVRGYQAGQYSLKVTYTSSD